MRVWQRRFVVLDEESLRYFKDRERRKFRGLIPLRVIHALCPSPERREFSFCLSTALKNGKQYYLQADSQEACDRWMDALRARVSASPPAVPPLPPLPPAEDQEDAPGSPSSSARRMSMRTSSESVSIPGGQHMSPSSASSGSSHSLQHHLLEKIRALGACEMEISREREREGGREISRERERSRRPGRKKN